MKHLMKLNIVNKKTENENNINFHFNVRKNILKTRQYDEVQN